MSGDTSWVDSMPEIYDTHLGPVLFAPFAAHLASIAAALRPGRVLELAAGTGIATAALVAALPGAEITATDLNPAMVSLGEQRVPRAGWRTADAQALDLPDDAFDLVVCQFGAMFFPDKPRAFAEAARVLRPGGILLLDVWDRVETSAFPAALVEAVAVVLADDSPCFLARVPHGYADLAQIAADVTAGGLVLDSIERVALPGTATSARSLAEGYCLGSPLRFELAEHGPVEPLTDAVAAEMTARLGNGQVHADLVALVVTAHKPV
jgi:SAM-dependent methyltransferase